MTAGSSRAVLAAAVLFLVACSGEDRDEVVVYCALDQEHAEKILADFEEQTGIAVRPVFDTEITKTVGLRNKIQQEKDHPRCDVFWNNEILNTLLLKEAGCLEPYESPSAASIPDSFKDPEHYWTGFAARARVFIVNREKCPEADAPTSYLDYLDPSRKDLWCIAKPVAGTTATHVAVLFDLLGPEETQRWMLGLRDNGAAIYNGNAHVMRQVREGVKSFGFTDTDDYNVALLEGYPVYAVYPDQGEGELGCLVIPNTISLIRGAPHPELGKRFIDYALSPAVEQRLAESRSAQIPVRPEVPCPPGVQRIDELRVMQVDFNRAAEHFAAAQDWIESTFLR